MSTNFQVGDLLVSHNEAPYALTTKGAIVLVVETQRGRDDIAVLLLSRVTPGHYYSWRDLLENHQEEKRIRAEDDFYQRRFWVQSQYFNKATDPKMRRALETALFPVSTTYNYPKKVLPKRLS